MLFQAIKTLFGTRNQRELPPVALQTLSQRVDYSLVAPNPWISAECINSQTGAVVGKVGYGLSPLADTVLLDGIEVELGVRRKGYGSAIVQAVSKAGLPGTTFPVTPVHIIRPSSTFWQVLQSGSVKDLLVRTDIRCGDIPSVQHAWRDTSNTLKYSEPPTEAINADSDQLPRMPLNHTTMAYSPATKNPIEIVTSGKPFLYLHQVRGSTCSAEAFRNADEFVSATAALASISWSESKNFDGQPLLITDAISAVSARLQMDIGYTCSSKNHHLGILYL